MKHIFCPFSLIAALSLIAMALAAETDNRSGARPTGTLVQDGRLIEKLEWYGPPLYPLMFSLPARKQGQVRS